MALYCHLLDSSSSSFDVLWRAKQLSVHIPPPTEMECEAMISREILIQKHKQIKIKKNLLPIFCYIHLFFSGNF